MRNLSSYLLATLKRIFSGFSGSGCGLRRISVNGAGVCGEATGNGTVANFGGHFEAAGNQEPTVRTAAANSRFGDGVYLVFHPPRPA
jgi:hypothetical protein